MNNFRITAAALVILSLTFLSAGCGDSPKVEKENTERFVLKDIYGQDRRWSEFAGKPLMINFWATWCGPCRKEIPLLIDFYRQHHDDKGLEIVGISIDHQRERVIPYVQQMKIPYVILYTDSKTPEEFGLGQGIPYTIFFDAEGNETGRITGAQPPPIFLNQLRKMFGEDM